MHTNCQRFIVTPPPILEYFEGDNIELPCEVENQEGSAIWLFNEGSLYTENRTKTRLHGFERVTIRGDARLGQHNLRIANAQLNDTGTFECHIEPIEDSPDHHFLQVATNLTVRPRPKSTHDGKFDTQNSLNSLNLSDQTQKVTSSSHNGISRDIHSMTRLPVSYTISSSPDSTNQTTYPSAFVSPHAPIIQSVNQGSGTSGWNFLSTLFGSSSSPSSSISSNSQTSINHHNHSSVWPNFVVIGWPYALIILAITLLLANIYLLYSLMKRHKSRKEQTKSQKNLTNSGLANNQLKFSSEAQLNPSPRGRDVVDRYETSSVCGIDSNGSASAGSDSFVSTTNLNQSTSASMAPILPRNCGSTNAALMGQAVVSISHEPNAIAISSHPSLQIYNPAHYPVVQPSSGFFVNSHDPQQQHQQQHQQQQQQQQQLQHLQQQIQHHQQQILQQVQSQELDLEYHPASVAQIYTLV